MNGRAIGVAGWGWNLGIWLTGGLRRVTAAILGRAFADGLFINGHEKSPDFGVEAFVDLRFARQNWGLGNVFDGYLGHHVALLDRVDDVLACGDFAKHGMLSIEPRAWNVGDEELRAVGVRAGIGHRENARAGVLQRGMEFIGKLVAWAAGAGAVWASRLNHEVRNNAMELQSVVKAFFGEVFKVLDGLGGLVRKQLALDGAAAGLNRCNFHLDSLSSIERSTKIGYDLFSEIANP